MKFWSAFLLLFLNLAASGQEKYQITVDLISVSSDRVKVTINTPAISDKEIRYIMPAVIPGSYSIKDFGRFVSDFTAVTKDGEYLRVRLEGNNTFVMRNRRGAPLSKIEYYVSDTWDMEKTSEKMTKEEFNFIFQPGGTNIDAGKNYVINHQGFYGYLDGHKMLPYEITYLKSEKLFASTALDVVRETNGRDVVKAANYVKLVDNPIMFSQADTVSFYSSNTHISISVFSENKAVSSYKIKQMLTPLSRALATFFNKKLPVDKYHFIFYFAGYKNSPVTKYGGFGALEHSYSSFYFLPEVPDELYLRNMVLSVVAHEFLHILTPLNIHSEEIEDFDFINPQMSQHLWMYEGVTEYLANLVQVRDSLISDSQFIDEMETKILNSKKYPDVSFTEMSKNILKKKYSGMYSNVYEKGALIGFLLDIRLHELSKGSMGLKDVMMKLSDKYGPDRPFKDDQLIPEIVSITYPEIKDFFSNYVSGSKPLPYDDYFSKLGWKFHVNKIDTVATFGNFGLIFNQVDSKFIVSRTDSSNAFGFTNGDEIIEVDGVTITSENYNEALSPLFKPVAEKNVAVRFFSSGEEKKLAVSPALVTLRKKFVIEDDPGASQDQIFLRKKMLSNYF